MSVLRIISSAKIAKGTRVIVRADLDVGLKNGKIVDDFRLRAGMPTFRYLLRRRARIRIVGYLGRPQGRRDKKLTLEPIAVRLEALLGRKVVFMRDPFREEAMDEYLESPEILLFENIRFWPEEIANSPFFARRIARWGDHYVNDAFANCHRREASLVALPRLLPAYAGLHLADEIAALERVMKNPKRPFIALLGGAKIETKLPMIRHFLRDADYVLIGGALANTVFSLMGKSVGKSRIDTRVTESARIFRDKKLFLPSDVVVTRSLVSRAAGWVSAIENVRPDEYIVDIGPQTRRIFSSIIRKSKTVVWNGPLGIAEINTYSAGTRALAQAIKNSNSFSVIGGGDTIAVLKRLNIRKGFDHVSTGGGAMLEFLSGKKLPALKVLQR